MTETALAIQNQTLLPGSPIGSLEAYMNTVSNIPVLSRDEEFRLATQYRHDDCLDSARELVISNLRFVVHIARGYSGYGLQLGDLVQGTGAAYSAATAIVINFTGHRSGSAYNSDALPYWTSAGSSPLQE